ncbi:MAG: hypothetical protein C9356_11890 [Oleiphilus sp.]|nr:MAG: hypothetical protein C9356_11890 [Oleiphilus sp.]
MNQSTAAHNGTQEHSTYSGADWDKITLEISGLAHDIMAPEPDWRLAIPTGHTPYFLTGDKPLRVFDLYHMQAQSVPGSLLATALTITGTRLFLIRNDVSPELRSRLECFHMSLSQTLHRHAKDCGLHDLTDLEPTNLDLRRYLAIRECTHHKQWRRAISKQGVAFVEPVSDTNVDIVLGEKNVAYSMSPRLAGMVVSILALESEFIACPKQFLESCLERLKQDAEELASNSGELESFYKAFKR